MTPQDPNDFSDQYNTALTPDEEAKFQQWLKTLPAGQQSSYDYDMRGAFKGGAAQAGNGHFPDTYKKPNHPTFSTESQYSTQDMPGGTWGGDDARGYVYKPSSTNLRFHKGGDLMDYFHRVEPNAQLLLPK